MRRADASAKGGWAAVKAAAFTDKDEPKQTGALRKASATQALPASPGASDQLVLVGADNSLGAYSYFPDTGTLGAGADWVSVPKGFREWMRKRLAGAGDTPKR